MDIKYTQHIATELNLSVKQINSVYQLHTEGSIFPFIARNRKEATGNLDEVDIGNVIKQIKCFNTK